MKYLDGNDVRLGDIVLDDQCGKGVVVFSIDSKEYSQSYPENEWKYLGKGVMIKFEQSGDVYYEGPEPYEGLYLLERIRQT